MTARPLSILVAHLELPLHDQSSASFRLRELLKLMVADDHRITFLARAGVGQERYVSELRAMGIAVIPWDPGYLRNHGHAAPGAEIDVAALLRRGRFDLAYLYFLESAELYLPLIRHHSPATRIIVDTVDVQFVRHQRGARLSGDPVAAANADSIRRREAACYAQADALVAVSDEDSAALTEIAPDVPVAVIGNIHPPASAGPGYDDRAGLLFVGAFHHAPNVDAVLDFHATAWPHVRRALPELSLTLVGGYVPPAVQDIDGDGVQVAGWVPELVPLLYRARVSIAPLRFGAGVKGKIGEAMSHGLPVVTTPIGAEGMGLLDSEHALVAKPGEAFADAVVRLYRDRELWERLARAGRAHIDADASPEATRVRLQELIGRLTARPFVVEQPWRRDYDLDRVLEGYLGAFEPASPVSLVLPVTPEDLAPESALERVLASLQRLGRDPESIPDVVISPCASDYAVPAGALRLDGTADPAPGWPEAAAFGVQPPTGPDASVIICTYGKRAYTERCLQSLAATLGPRLGGEVEVVVVDNASPDDTLSLLAQWQDRIRVVALDVNRNFAGGNNVGAAVARGRVLVFINNDIEVQPGALEALVEEASRPGVGVVGARLLYPDGRIQHGGFAWRSVDGRLIPFHAFQWEDANLPQAGASFDTSSVTGACMAIPRETFAAVGGFDEGYVNGWEDVDLCLRILATGARIRQRGDAMLVHHEGVTTGRSYNDQANARRFAGRWGSSLAPDTALVARLGARFNQLVDCPVPPDSASGARARVIGPLLGLGPAGAEARGLWQSLETAQIDAAAVTPASSAIGPALGEADLWALHAAHLRPSSPEAVTIVVPDGSVTLSPRPGDRPGLMRVAAVPEHVYEHAHALAATPALAEALVEAGWPEERVTHLPPCGVRTAPGAGGAGILCVLDNDPATTSVVLQALSSLREVRIRVAPLARTDELIAVCGSLAPHAELVAPITDEAELARIAGESDLVVAVGAPDPYGRLGLSVCGSGAAFLTRPDDPACGLLADLADTWVRASPRPLRAAIEAALARPPSGRWARIALVRAVQDRAAEQLVELVKRVARSGGRREGDAGIAERPGEDELAA
jgi:GT2 family glycosyltransferase/glycosyltransferase involved in cell wall biosynthesis